MLLRNYALALGFFTRIPLGNIAISKEQSEVRQSLCWFPMAGFTVGLILVVPWMVFSSLWPQEIAVALTLAVSMLLTGGLHEDGLADFTDGFGASDNKEKILEIMKDSRLGSYGALSLVTTLLIKYAIFCTLETTLVPFAIVLSATLSRFWAITTLWYLPPLNNGLGATFANPELNLKQWGLLFLPLLFLLLVNFSTSSIAIMFSLIAFIVIVRQINKTLAGYNGDCLGAIQQATEIACLLAVGLL